MLKELVFLSLGTTTLSLLMMRRFFRTLPTICTCIAQNTKLVVVTGASSGIGLETARELCGRGHSVILACRNNLKATPLFLELQSISPNVRLMKLDLEDTESIKEFVGRLAEQNEPVDILVNNAGIMAADPDMDHDGFDKTMRVNYLGTMLLTELMIERVLLRNEKSKEKKPRVVFVSSSLAHKGQLDENDPLRSVIPWSYSKAYANSKLALNLYAQQLDRKYKREMRIYTVITGGMVHSDLNRDLIAHLPYYVKKLINWLSRLILLSPKEGCQSIVHCCVSGDVKNAHLPEELKQLQSSRNGSGILYRHCKPVNWPETSINSQLGAKLMDKNQAYCARII